MAWYESDNTQNFTTHVITTEADHAYGVCAADLDGDGYVDVMDLLTVIANWNQCNKA